MEVTKKVMFILFIVSLMVLTSVAMILNSEGDNVVEIDAVLSGVYQALTYFLLLVSALTVLWLLVEGVEMWKKHKRNKVPELGA